MNKRFIIANWKSNKTRNDAREWLQQFVKRDFVVPEGKEVVICPPYHLLFFINDYLLEHIAEIKTGSQDVSPFGAGAYTGEVHAEQLEEAADYTIIGHSERRKYFSETDEMLFQKTKMAIASDVMPIYCVQGNDTAIPDEVTFVAYEPVSAIGTGHPDTPEDAQAVAKSIKTNHPQVTVVLYGGSVSPDNVSSFTSLPDIDGVLVGGASLDPEKFVQIIENA